MQIKYEVSLSSDYKYNVFLYVEALMYIWTYNQKILSMLVFFLIDDAAWGNLFFFLYVPPPAMCVPFVNVRTVHEKLPNAVHYILLFN